jgi:uncharacterized membrane protein YphA (DoxX/SURF4 family)
MNRAALTRGLIAAPDARVARERGLTRVAVVSGVIFFFAGLVKFVFHHWELHAFQDFGLPYPSELEIFAGVLETLGGVALARCRWVVPTAVLLSITMIVAIISSGIDHGDVIPSLTLAPALLLAMLYLRIGTLARWPAGRVAAREPTALDSRVTTRSPAGVDGDISLR